MHSLLRRVLNLQLALLAFLLTPAVVLAQETATKSQAAVSLTGKYEGVANGPNGDVQMTLELVDEAGKFSGRITTPNATYDVNKGQFVDGVLSLELQAKDSVAKLSLHRQEEKLVGVLSAHGRTGPVEFRQAPKDEISGNWEAAADAPGHPFPFTLSLKLEGEMVTGSSDSELGNTTISSGVWKEGKLVLVLESGSGQVGLVATLQDGKLVGDYDFAGQMQGKWVAVKKK